MGDESEQLMILLKMSASPFGTEPERDRLHKLEDEISEAIFSAGVGDYDGNEIGEGEFSFFMFGPSARRLLEFVRPIIFRVPVLPDSYAVMRFGGPNDEEERVELCADKESLQ